MRKARTLVQGPAGEPWSPRPKRSPLLTAAQPASEALSQREEAPARSPGAPSLCLTRQETQGGHLAVCGAVPPARSPGREARREQPRTRRLGDPGRERAPAPPTLTGKRPHCPENRGVRGRPRDATAPSPRAPFPKNWPPLRAGRRDSNTLRPAAEKTRGRNTPHLGAAARRPRAAPLADVCMTPYGVTS